jgi:hypothetical protein
VPGGPLKLFLSLILILSCQRSSAEENKSSKKSDEGCEFTLACENGGKKFSLTFKSVAGECTEDDMKLSFESEGKSHDLGIKPDWYDFTDHISKTQESICSQGLHAFTAYSLDSKTAILFVKENNRPGYDLVTVILLDTQNEKTLDTKKLGETRNNYIAVLKTKNGFKVRIVRDSLSFHKEVMCDCDAPFVDDWMGVQMTKDHKIKADWLK